MNDSGQIVREYLDLNGVGHGYVATPRPEPSRLFSRPSAYLVYSATTGDDGRGEPRLPGQVLCVHGTSDPSAVGGLARLELLDGRLARALVKVGFQESL